MLRRIHVVFTLRAAADHAAAERAHAHYRMKCPVYRSIYRAIEVTSELRFEPAGPPEMA